MSPSPVRADVLPTPVPQTGCCAATATAATHRRTRSWPLVTSTRVSLSSVTLQISVGILAAIVPRSATQQAAINRDRTGTSTILRSDTYIPQAASQPTAAEATPATEKVSSNATAASTRNTAVGPLPNLARQYTA